MCSEVKTYSAQSRHSERGSLTWKDWKLRGCKSTAEDKLYYERGSAARSLLPCRLVTPAFYLREDGSLMKSIFQSIVTESCSAFPMRWGGKPTLAALLRELGLLLPAHLRTALCTHTSARRTAAEPGPRRGQGAQATHNQARTPAAGRRLKCTPY